MNETGHYHLAGIGGVGMSALAQALSDAGARVSGSDRFLDQGRTLEVFAVLRDAGIELTPQDGSAVTPGVSALVVSTAVEPGNPEREAAVRLGIPVVHRADLLARLVEDRRLVAVGGTCGKTTVTGLAGWLLEQAGRDPMVVNGGAVADWQTTTRLGSVRAGMSPWAVIEADESDRSFLRFHPEWAVVTNISKDHFEFEEAVALFRQFAGRTRAGVLAGPEAAEALRGAATIRIIPDPGNPTPAPGGGMAFTFDGTRFEIGMPGRHNARNACAALAVARELGVDPASLREPLRRFRGIRRRLERVGACRDAAVFDDYAHNPEKIRAAWSAVAETAGRVVGVWRPHGFGPLSLMMPELVDGFAAALRPDDVLWLLPVFYAGGTASGAATSDELAGRLRALGKRVNVAADYGGLEAELRALLRAGDALLVMGARDPDLPLFARRMGAQQPSLS